MFLPFTWPLIPAALKLSHPYTPSTNCPSPPLRSPLNESSWPSNVWSINSSIDPRTMPCGMEYATTPSENKGIMIIIFQYECILRRNYGNSRCLCRLFVKLLDQMLS